MLETIEERLKEYECVHRGSQTPSIVPVHQYPTYIVIKVGELDPKTAKFPDNEFYLVTGLQVKQAGFLFAEAGAASSTSQPGRLRNPTSTASPTTISCSVWSALRSQGELLEEASKLYRKRFPNAP